MVIPHYLSPLKQRHKPPPPFTQICPSFLARGADWKPLASIPEIGTPALSPEDVSSPACQDSSSLSSSLLSLRLWRLSLQPSFWPSLSRDSEIAPGAALRDYTLLLAHHCRQTYTPQRVTGPLLEGPMANLAWRSAFVQPLVTAMHGPWPQCPIPDTIIQEGKGNYFCFTFIFPNPLGCFCRMATVNKLGYKMSYGKQVFCVSYKKHLSAVWTLYRKASKK